MNSESIIHMGDVCRVCIYKDTRAIYCNKYQVQITKPGSKYLLK